MLSRTRIHQLYSRLAPGADYYQALSACRVSTNLDKGSHKTPSLWTPAYSVSSVCALAGPRVVTQGIHTSTFLLRVKVPGSFGRALHVDCRRAYSLVLGLHQ